MMIFTAMNITVHQDFKSMQWTSRSCLVVNCVLNLLLTVWLLSAVVAEPASCA